MKKSISIISESPHQTRKIGQTLGKLIANGSLLALQGELGSGKTVFVQGLAKGLGFHSRVVKSPTFATVQEYRGERSLCHVDLYRRTSTEMPLLGLEDYWRSPLHTESQNWILAIEWADKAESFLSKWGQYVLKIDFIHQSVTSRRLIFSGTNRWKKILIELQRTF